MNKYPLINFTVIFICGIILQKYLDFSSAIILLFISFELIAAIILTIYSRKADGNVLIVIIIYTTVLSLGQLDLKINYPVKNVLHESLFYSNVELWGEIRDINLIKNDSFDFTVKADSLTGKGKKIKTNVSLVCRYYGTSIKDTFEIYDKISIGNKVHLQGKLTKSKQAGNPGEFDYSSVLRDRGIEGILNINKSSGIIILSDHRSLYDFVFKLRKQIDNTLRELHGTQGAALLRGLLLADRSIIDIELKDFFINAGVIHLLAVSGLHVGYIVLIIFVLTGRFNLYLRSILTITGLIFFTLITGMPSSVVRASIMAVILILAFLSGRSTNLFNSLALAALAILLFKPIALFEPGFQLSFSAVLSIVLFYPKFRAVSLTLAKNNKMLKNILLFLSVSLAAQIITVPIIIYYFGKISLAGIFANIIAIPAVGIIVGIGIVTIFLNSFMHFAASYFAASNEILILAFNSFVSFTGGLEYSHLTVRGFPLIDVLIFYSFMIFFIVFSRKFKGYLKKIIFSVLIIINIAVYSSLDNRNLTAPNLLSLIMIDVGQGDSFLIKFPNGRTALIDAGMATSYFDNGERRIKPLLKYLNIDSIDYAFVSHVDADHYSGFVSLVHMGMIKSIYKPKLDSANKKDLKFENFLNKSGIPIHFFEKGIIKIGNVRLYVLNSGRPGRNYKNTTNDGSGFIKILFGKTSYLFTGDLEKSAELFYCGFYGNFLKSNVLKVSHHGSGGASCASFLQYVQPEFCLISAGIGNKFGHPAASTMEKLESLGSKILRTDISGASLLQSDGKKISLVNWR